MTLKRTWVLSAAVATLFLGGATVGDRSSTEVAWTTSMKALESDMGGIRKQISASLRELDEAKTNLRRLDRVKRAADDNANRSRTRADAEIEKLKKKLAAAAGRAEKAEATIRKRDEAISKLEREARRRERSNRDEIRKKDGELRKLDQRRKQEVSKVVQDARAQKQEMEKKALPCMKNTDQSSS